MSNIGDAIHTVFIQSFDGLSTTISNDKGEQLGRVTSAVIWLDANELARVDLTILAPSVDVKAKVQVVSFDCPVCAKTITHHCHPGDGEDGEF